MTSASPPAKGVATTTPVAFMAAGMLYLERMNILAEDGCGILCDTLPLIGEEIPLCFKLSTSQSSIRCKARVMALVPTTPAGVKAFEEGGEKGLHAVTGGVTGDSVTMMFRLADLKEAAAKSAAPSPPAPNRPAGKAVGFCVRFVDLSGPSKAAVARHLKISRRLSDQLSTRGSSVVSLSEDDRKTMTRIMEDESLSDRARDW